jgi:hypothetical protein
MDNVLSAIAGDSTNLPHGTISAIAERSALN